MSKGKPRMKIVPVAYQALRPVMEKIGGAMRMLAEIGWELADKQGLNNDQTRALLDEMFMLVVQRMIKHWVDVMQEAHFRAFNQLSKEREQRSHEGPKRHDYLG